MKKQTVRKFSKSELQQITEIKYLIKENKLNADIEKIKAWVQEQPGFSWPQFLLSIYRDLYKEIIPSYFKKVRILSNGHYTKEEAADYLHVTVGRIDQLASEGKPGSTPIEFIPNIFKGKSQRLILGSVLIKYKKNKNNLTLKKY